MGQVGGWQTWNEVRCFLTMVFSLAAAFNDLHIVSFTVAFDSEAQSGYATADDKDGYPCCFPSLHVRRFGTHN